MMKLKIGDRVRPSEKGILANIFSKPYQLRSGVVIAMMRGIYPAVKWDGRKYFVKYAPEFIAIDNRQPPPKDTPNE